MKINIIFLNLLLVLINTIVYGHDIAVGNKNKLHQNSNYINFSLDRDLLSKYVSSATNEWRYTVATSIFYYLNVSDKHYPLDSNIEGIIEEIKNHNKKEEVIKDTVSYTIQIHLPATYEYKPMFALKTNLLFDLASIVNVEIPIGKRWSVAGEWIFPWWTWNEGSNADAQHRFQLLNVNIECKYWLGNRKSC